MRVLIFSVSAGGGHKNAAEALAEEIQNRDPESQVKVIDTIKYISPALDKLVIGTYLNSLKIYPNAFKALYAMSDISAEDDVFHLLTSKIQEIIAEKLIPLINDFKPDILVSTHPFTAFMLHVIRSKFGLDTPNLVILTDYGSHSMWAHTEIDKYVVADEAMIPELTVRGVKWENVEPLGIPVRRSLKTHYDRETTLRKIGLDGGKKTITLMGGSLAMGNIKSLLLQIESIPGDFNIVVVAAKNKKLYDEAVEISLISKKSITVLGYCNFINSLMQASDLLITKPGGLTVTEAMINGVPMAIFSAIPGQEAQNEKFLLRNDLAFPLKSHEDLKSIVEMILRDDPRLKAMSSRLKAKSKPDSTINIVNLLENQLAEYRDKQALGVPTLAWSEAAGNYNNGWLKQKLNEASSSLELDSRLDKWFLKLKSSLKGETEGGSLEFSEASFEEEAFPQKPAVENPLTNRIFGLKNKLAKNRIWKRRLFKSASPKVSDAGSGRIEHPDLRIS